MRRIWLNCELLNALVAPAQAGDQDAIAALLGEAYGLAGRIIRANGWHVHSGGDDSDLMQAGVIKLAQSIQTYRPERFNNFAAFAAYVVQKGILSEVRRLTRLKHRLLSQALPLDAPIKAKARTGRNGDMPDRIDLPDTRHGVDPLEAVSYEIGPEALLAILRKENSPWEDVVLDQYILGGRPGKDLAAEAGRSHKAVDNAAMRVRGRMARVAVDLLDEEHFTPEIQGMLRRAVAGRRLYERKSKRTAS